MSAHAYIQWADVPDHLIAGSSQRVDSITQAKVIAFDGCPLCGEIEQEDANNPTDRVQVQFPFPRAAELRHSLVDWFIYHGISFTVVAA
ncbi:phage portal protein [Paraburkholderia phymatum]|uniref:GP65 n=1 Tax=Paraburkholderia phymatum (strain DSM 17167 / CIP 108236 / LMG 21445 / STM815) TaxID=391038 RepID=B2JD19_PARP8|nr:hypothetical protein [Paraburkholderia phymatum]ACC71075.1 GP65 [Paraburkholderia phymatum STM815]